MLLVTHLEGLGIVSQATQTEITTAMVVGAVRTMNTFEMAYRGANGRFAGRDELLGFLQQKGILSKMQINLRNPRPYELTITPNQDGSHYQIAFKVPSDPNDKNAWCKTAAFTDDAGVIFLGSALDCEAPTR